MKKIGIIARPGKGEAIDVLKGLIPWLTGHDCEVYVDTDTSRHLGIVKTLFRECQREEMPRHVGLILALGGDGTMLAAARCAAQKGTPLFGINLGGLGFITEVNKSEIYGVIEKVVSGECDIQQRIMLDASVIRAGKGVCYFTVLNDLVINKGALARIFDIEVSIDGRYVTTYKADGLIFATPTGSTAYSLSAGGPILYPTMHCLVITPICPHMLTNRPIVVPDDSVIEATVKTGSEDICLTLDGQMGFHLKQDDVIEIRKSAYKTSLVIPYERDYFQILREKLKWGQR
ncbi:NAD(+)/NADH kinase [Candidatus Magnetominusculus dajiuhuensis]|uniref:NAD(+)/NADH kinase n=1 Tax=Candidatus Magnetominusculus dajiuhuensis TaxID=3137712 RepID=UPI003B433CEF